jgi:hypothetical protein
LSSCFLIDLSFSSVGRVSRTVERRVVATLEPEDWMTRRMLLVGLS